MASKKRKGLTIVISAGAVTAVLGVALPRIPAPATANDIAALARADAHERRARFRDDSILRSGVDTLQLGVRYLVCREAEQDKKHGSPATCAVILKGVGDFYREAKK